MVELMAIYALIQSGVVVNTVVAESGDAKDNAYTWVDITSVTPAPSHGWTYDGNIFTDSDPLVAE
jgi:hypothetical protein